MKRLVAIPLASLCACTITVAPIKDKPQRTYWYKQSRRHEAETVHKPAAKPSPSVTPVINQIHEQYKPIYEKLPYPQKQEAPRPQITSDTGP